MATSEEQYRARLNDPEYQRQEQVLEGLSGDLSVNPTIDGSVEMEVYVSELQFLAEVLEDTLPDGEFGKVKLVVFGDDAAAFVRNVERSTTSVTA